MYIYILIIAKKRMTKILSKKEKNLDKILLIKQNIFETTSTYFLNIK